MFGKKTMNSTDRFVMNQGRAAGNLKDAGPNFKGLKKPPVKAQPMKGQQAVAEKKEFKSRPLHTTGTFRK